MLDNYRKNSRVQHRKPLDCPTQDQQSRHNGDKQKNAPTNNTSGPGQEQVSKDTHTITDAYLCPLCFTERKYISWGQCNHVFCADCSHRMRVLYRNNACPFCKQSLTKVFVAHFSNLTSSTNEALVVAEERSHIPFEEVVRDPDVVFDTGPQMYFQSQEILEIFKCLRSVNCPQCEDYKDDSPVSATKKALNASTLNSQPVLRLKNHVRSVHKKVFCDTCLLYKKAFYSEQLLFDASFLRKHVKDSHPFCEFCKKNYLDDDSLYDHLQKDHQTCFLCERNGKYHQYYRNFNGLEQHYKKEHYMCEDPQCRGIVFETPIDLRLHQMSHNERGAHTNENRSRTLHVNLAELHDLSAASTSRRARQSNGRHQGNGINPRVADEAQERQRRNVFSSSSVIFLGSEQNAPGPSNQDALQASGTNTDTLSKIETKLVSQQLPQPQQPQQPQQSQQSQNAFIVAPLPENEEELLKRNEAIVRTMQNYLDPASFEIFQASSFEFANGEKPAENYIDEVVSTFGLHVSKNILSELIALLPEEDLRNKLVIAATRSFDPKGSSSSKKQPEPTSASTYAQTSNTVSNSLTSSESKADNIEDGRKTSNTGQRRKDTSYASLEEEFPALGVSKEPISKLAASSVYSGKAPTNRNNIDNFPALTSTSKKEMGLGSIMPSSSTTFSNNEPKVPTAKDSFPALSKSKTKKNAPVSWGGAPMAAGSSRISEQEEFPSLTKPTTSTGNRGTFDTSEEDRIPSDVGMRVGAVWGGTGTQVKKQRAQAIQQRKYDILDNSLPKDSGTQNTQTSGASTMEIRAQELDKVHFPKLQAQKKSGVSSEGPTTMPKNGKVLDINELIKERKANLAKSNVPKIGSYGLPWENAKAKAKTKEIKKNYG